MDASFSLNFTSHFLDLFSSSTKTNIRYILTVTLQPFNMSSMALKTKKSTATKPHLQPPTSAPKRARKPSSKVTESAPLDSSD